MNNDTEKVKTLLAEASKAEVPPSDPDQLTEATCHACGEVMTREEVHFFADRCVRCEEKAHARLTAWREGAHDPALDAGRFFVMPEVH